MSQAVVFNGINALDFEDIRHHAVRIPEVLRQIQKAQDILDKHQNIPVDLLSFITSEDEVYLRSIKMKSLCASIVQVGLYERYLKQFTTPDFLVGNVNGESAAKVAAGYLSFEELVMESQAVRLQAKSENESASSDAFSGTVLSGMSLTSYSVFKSDGEKFKKLPVENMDVNKIIDYLVDDYRVDKFINIGPGNLILNEAHQKLALSDVQILESIDLDPLLSWFWPSMKKTEAVVSVQ